MLHFYYFYQNLHLLGLMTILPYLEHVKATQKLYAHTRKMQQKIKQSINPACVNLSIVSPNPLSLKLGLFCSGNLKLSITT